MGWMGSTLALYTSNKDELISGITIPKNQANAKAYNITIPPLNKTVFQGQEDISYKPPITGPFFSLTLSMGVSFSNLTLTGSPQGQVPYIVVPSLGEVAPCHLVLRSLHRPLKQRRLLSL